MAPPTNISALTATDLGVLPADVTQNVNDAGLNYTVWYKFTTPANARVIGAWGFTTIADSYASTIKPYSGPASAPVQILFIAAINKPIQFPVIAGNEYFLEFTKNNNNSPASLRIQVEVAPLDDITRGCILVNDDTGGFPLAALSKDTDYTVLNFVKDIVAGEAGDIIHSLIASNNVILLSDETSFPNVFILYSSEFNILATIPVIDNGTPRARANQTTSKFYIGTAGTGGGFAKFSTISPAGVQGSVVILPAAGMTALAGNNDDTILYHSGQINSINTPISRWNIPGGVALTDFVVGETNHLNGDILILKDGSILISYWKSTVTRDLFIRRYNAAGVLLNTYSLGSSFTSTLPRMAYALDNPNSFWVMTHPIAGGLTQFFNIKCSDGSILITRVHTEYEGGAYEASETATPTNRFGNSFSCPFLIFGLNQYSGLYFFSFDKTNDTIISGGVELDLKIPNPLIKTGFM